VKVWFAFVTSASAAPNPWFACGLHSSSHARAPNLSLALGRLGRAPYIQSAPTSSEDGCLEVKTNLYNVSSTSLSGSITLLIFSFPFSPTSSYGRLGLNNASASAIPALFAE
jgi:hypothetical protein